jgi:hypothetical protein
MTTSYITNDKINGFHRPPKQHFNRMMNDPQKKDINNYHINLTSIATCNI